MKAGAWHQCCFNSQNLVEEQLQNGIGSGVILSPKDVSQKNLGTYGQKYKDAGAELLIDQQFYVPEFSNKNLESYAISSYRPKVSNLTSISDSHLDGLANELFELHKDLSADGVISPALAYETGRPDIVHFNARLFETAKRVGDALGLPTYGTVVVGNSAINADDLVDGVISDATALDCNGFYFGFDFGAGERIPSNKNHVYRALTAGLSLACTGKPVMQAFAGPFGLLSFGYGASAATIGHFQNVWQFDRKRWGAAEEGGGGSAPPRFFSSALWSTIVYPDEVEQLSSDSKKVVVTPSSFSTPVSKAGATKWPKWDSYKHLVTIIGKRYDELGKLGNARKSSQIILQQLNSAVSTHKKVAAEGIALKDGSNSYQQNWHDALTLLLKNRTDDFDYLDML